MKAVFPKYASAGHFLEQVAQRNPGQPEFLQADGNVSYIDGANVAGFVKVADATLAQGVV